MIVFDLKCGASHVFEAWFGSSTDWEDQRGRGLVSCPICGSAEVEKAVMAPAVPAKGNQRIEAPVAAAAGEDSSRMKHMLEMLAKAQTDLIRNADYVGNRFADEARAMHLGESDQRQIYGETTRDEAKSLVDEGVAILPLPLPIRRKTDS